MLAGIRLCFTAAMVKGKPVAINLMFCIETIIAFHTKYRGTDSINSDLGPFLAYFIHLSF